MDSERVAEIRNKLQASRTVLEMLLDGKTVSKEDIKLALSDLSNAVSLLGKFSRRGETK